MVKGSLLISVILVAISVSACGPTVVKPASTKSIITSPIPESAAPRAYHIGVGDEVELKFFYTPELNDRMAVRPDGKISVMFAQDVQAAGLTAEQLAHRIKRKLASHIKQLDLVVIVRTFTSQKVYVGGEVGKPGPVQFTARENLLQVINDAGWLTPLASRDKVLLVRRDSDGEDAIYPINLRRILSGEDMSQNVTLQAGDLVLVPPSGSVEMDRWVDQNVRQMIPVTAGVFINGSR